MRILLLPVLLIAGCATVPQDEAAVGRVCDSAKAGKLIGRTRSEANGAEALRLTGARTLRWIPPGGIVTMDYREDRLNLRLDKGGRIARIDCG